MKMTLTEWLNQNEPPENNSWISTSLNQFNFVQKNIKSCVGQHIVVIGEHFSKSLVLPTYQIVFPGITINFQNNFHGWLVSVCSEKPVTGLNGFNFKFYISTCNDFKLPSYTENNKKFAIELYSDFDLYLLFKLLINTQKR